jgi:hypothetical protein
LDWFVLKSSHELKSWVDHKLIFKAFLFKEYVSICPQLTITGICFDLDTRSKQIRLQSFQGENKSNISDG